MTLKEREFVPAAEKVFAAAVTTIDDVRAVVEAKVKTAYDQAIAMTRPQEAEPYEWWNLYSYGPLQTLAPEGPMAPYQVLKVGEEAYIATVLVLNPLPILPPAPGISPMHLLSDFSLPYEVRYQTGNLTNWLIGQPNVTNTGNLVPGQGIYVDVLHFTATQPGLMEMNITARILGTPPNVSAPHFAGFARYVYDFDPEMFWSSPTPGWHFDMPVKFMVYP